MVSHSFRGLLLALLFLSSPSLYAQVDNILTSAPGFRPLVTFFERYAEKVVTVSEEGEVMRFQEARPESISAHIVANIKGSDLSEITEDTPVGVTIGGFDFRAVLADDPRYSKGKRSATFALTGEVETPSGEYRTKRFGTVRFSWTSRILTINVICTNLNAAGYSDIAASTFIGMAEAGQSVSLNDESVNVAVNFGSLFGTGTSLLRGSSKTIRKTFGRPSSDFYEEFELPLVVLSSGKFVEEESAADQ